MYDVMFQEGGVWKLFHRTQFLSDAILHCGFCRAAEHPVVVINRLTGEEYHMGNKNGKQGIGIGG